MRCFASLSFGIPSVIVLMTISSVGCGDPKVERVPVSGVVLIDGKPLDGGTIRFVPETGRPASSAIRADGRFEVANEGLSGPAELGLLPGEYRVQVSSSEIVDDETINWKAPQHYADFRTSGLVAVIDGPTSDLTFELQSQTDEEKESSSDKADEAPPEEGATEQI